MPPQCERTEGVAAFDVHDNDHNNIAMECLTENNDHHVALTATATATATMVAQSALSNNDITSWFQQQLSSLPSKISSSSSSWLLGFRNNKKKRILFLVIATLCMIGSVTFLTLYTTCAGFRRTISFWSFATPLLVQYYTLKIQIQYWNPFLHHQLSIIASSSPFHSRNKHNCNNKNSTTCTTYDPDIEWEKRMRQFHATVAPKVVRVIEKMGGIYVKVR